MMACEFGFTSIDIFNRSPPTTPPGGCKYKHDRLRLVLDKKVSELVKGRNVCDG